MSSRHYDQHLQGAGSNSTDGLFRLVPFLLGRSAAQETKRFDVDRAHCIVRARVRVRHVR